MTTPQMPDEDDMVSVHRSWLADVRAVLMGDDTILDDSSGADHGTTKQAVLGYLTEVMGAK